MGNVRFKLNLPGLNELMKSAAMQGVLNSAASSIAAAAGSGDYKVEAAHSISFIAIASVSAATRKARKDCNENNTLLKAAGGTRI